MKQISAVYEAVLAGWDTSRDIADETGLSIAVVSSTLNALRKANLVRVTRRECVSYPRPPKVHQERSSPKLAVRQQ